MRRFACHRKLVRLVPRSAAALSALLYTLHYSPEYDGRNWQADRIKERVPGHEVVGEVDAIFSVLQNVKPTAETVPLEKAAERYQQMSSNK